MGPFPIDAVPGLARIAVGAWARGAVWGVGTTLKATRRLGEAAVSGESASELLDEVRDETVANLRRVLGVVDRDAPGSRSGRINDAVDSFARAQQGADQARSLRVRGAALFDRAADVDAEGGGIHPGFDRIVDQLAPDEARILALLVNEGPQAIVYINKAAPLGIGAREVARRLSLIGSEAGCLRPELVSAYLDNLVRLGLVAIRRDPIPGEDIYQVVEAQPEVTAAMKRAGGPIFKGQSTRRSVHITDFGRAFCQVAFPPERLTGEFEAIEIPADQDVIPPEADPEGEHT